MPETQQEAPTTHAKLLAWVDEVAELTQPDAVHWCDGSAEEYDRLCAELVEAGTFEKLSDAKRPNSYLARSDPGDVARVEDRTFICSEREEDAGPTNNWRDPEEMRETPRATCSRARMQGRTMYVVPFSMGPLGSPIAHVGVQLTDSPYVAASMRIMTRMGQGALDVLGEDGDFVPCLHSVGMPLADGVEDVPWPCDADNKYIVHFPETREIWSYGSGYGGNALLGKKCFALRIASVMARDEGWLAEHMLILKVTSPEGEVKHITGAFPSACGKTNLAMLIPTIPGWKVETIGDDIAWMKFGDDGRLYAINPEAGFFGVAPGHRREDQPERHGHAARELDLHQLREDRRRRRLVGGDDPRAARATRSTGTATTGRPTPTSRRPTPTRASRRPPAQCPSMAPEWEDPAGVPIDAFLFGGRRSTVVPLVTRRSTGSTASSSARSCPRRRPRPRRARWASCASTRWRCCRSAATTWPTTSPTGWRSASARARCCRRSSTSTGSARTRTASFLWPGFGENSRVIEWVFRRCDDDAEAEETPIGLVPAAGALNTEGLDVSEEAMAELLRVDPEQFKAQLPQVREHYARFGDDLPDELRRQLEALEERLG